MMNDFNNSNMNLKIERLKTSKNLEESIKRNDEIRRLQKEKEKEGNLLGASVSVIGGGCRFQAIRNICKMFNLGEE